MIIAPLAWVSPALAAQPKTAELRGDRWIEVAAPATQAQASADPEIERIEQLVRQRRNTEARKRLVAWLKSKPDSPVRDTGPVARKAGWQIHPDSSMATSLAILSRNLTKTFSSSFDSLEPMMQCTAPPRVTPAIGWPFQVCW